MTYRRYRNTSKPTPRSKAVRYAIIAQTITFFPSEATAKKLAEANGGEADGFVVAAAKGREGKFVVQVVDTDDGLLMGHL